MKHKLQRVRRVRCAGTRCRAGLLRLIQTPFPTAVAEQRSAPFRALRDKILHSSRTVRGEAGASPRRASNLSTAFETSELKSLCPFGILRAAQGAWRRLATVGLSPQGFPYEEAACDLHSAGVPSAVAVVMAGALAACSSDATSTDPSPSTSPALATASTGNGAPSGAHYNLNIIAALARLRFGSPGTGPGARQGRIGCDHLPQDGGRAVAGGSGRPGRLPLRSLP